jgi:flagellar motor switch protein FliM
VLTVKRFRVPVDNERASPAHRADTVTNQVTAEELQAILASDEPSRRAPAAIAARDFKQPRRLSSTALARLQRSARKAEPAIAAALATWLRRPIEVEILSVSEVDAREVVAGWKDPVSILCFDCAGLPGWLVWDAVASASAAEIALGASEIAEAKARTLSPVESVLIGGLLAKAAALAGQALGLETKNARFAATTEEIGALGDLPRNADPRRVVLEIALSGDGVASTLRLYLPGVASPATDAAPAPAKDKKRATLPAHLGSIEVEIEARLGSVEVMLSDLLALEVGDVLLLGADRGADVELCVEGEACARARFGVHEGRLAVRIESVEGSREIARGQAG